MAKQHVCWLIEIVYEKSNRDKIMEPGNVGEVWEIANNPVWLGFMIFAWVVHGVPNIS